MFIFIFLFSAADNKTLIAVGGVAILAVAGIAAGNNSGAVEGQAAPAAAGAGASSDTPANVAQARAWIAAWRKKYNKA